jgi:DNA-binding MarR family transcriptional regulator/N-acetylglutamate synthase-like GNAT family acetyltransferase
MSDILATRADSVRAFNRFYTQKIGVLDEGYLDTGYPVAALRVVFEIGQRGQAIAAGLARDLDLDQGYVSRLVKRLRRDGLVDTAPSPIDRRQAVLSLTDEGQSLFARIDQRSTADATALLAPLPGADQARLVAALREARQLLGDASPAPPPMVILREPRPGDFGWIVEAHGVLYHREHGFDARFEATAAEVVAAYLRAHDPERERWWIAERDGERVGCVGVTRGSESVAKLRLLLVDPGARGHGLGRTLVRECMRFARDAGYRTLTLWTVDVLAAARHIYASEGFRLVHAEPYDGFGRAVMSETWDLAL